MIKLLISPKIKKKENSCEFNFNIFYFRITPPYMLVLATYSFLYIYLGEGPMWPKSLNVCDKCHTDWWRHLLYVNNLVGVDGVDAVDQV